MSWYLQEINGLLSNIYRLNKYMKIDSRADLILCSLTFMKSVA